MSYNNEKWTSQPYNRSCSETESCHKLVRRAPKSWKENIEKAGRPRSCSRSGKNHTAWTEMEGYSL